MVITLEHSVFDDGMTRPTCSDTLSSTDKSVLRAFAASIGPDGLDDLQRWRLRREQAAGS
jgi:hypothetical protein